MKRNGVLNCLTRLAKDRRGGVMAYVAVAAPVLVGAAGLSVDSASWHMQQKALQSMADSAALDGALERMRTDDTQINSAAQSDAERNGFKAGLDIIAINHPPSAGSSFAGSGDAVEVAVTRNAPTFLTSLIVGGPVSISARATARGQINDTCVWSLDPTASGAITVSGGANVNLGCGTFVNSNDPEALVQTGSSCFTTTEIKSAGGIDDGGCINTATTSTGVSQIEDPLGAVAAPSYGACDINGKTTVKSGDSLTLSPDADGKLVICNDLTVQSGGTLHFDPGIYIFDEASISFHGTVTGSNVNFYLTDAGASNDNISINAGSNVTLSANPFGELPGILFYHDRNSIDGISHNFNGGANMQLEGILYFPNQHLKFAGGSSLDATKSMIVAKTVTFTGNTDIGGIPSSAIAANPLLVEAKLVE